jgi:hypothetical protein
MSDGHPNWDIDTPWGEAGQRYVQDVLSWPGVAKIEVKRKRRFDAKIYVELEQNPFGKGWRPSGLAVTESELWAWVVEDTGAFMLFRAEHLRAALTQSHRWIRAANEEDGDCPTRGALIDAPSLFEWISVHYSPFGETRFWCEACGRMHALEEHDACRRAAGDVTWVSRALRQSIQKLQRPAERTT